MSLDEQVSVTPFTMFKYPVGQPGRKYEKTANFVVLGKKIMRPLIKRPPPCGSPLSSD